MKPLLAETQIIELPYDLTRTHRVSGAIQHRDGRCTIECQCGRGVSDRTAQATLARWHAHLAEVTR